MYTQSTKIQKKIEKLQEFIKLNKSADVKFREDMQKNYMRGGMDLLLQEVL